MARSRGPGKLNVVLDTSVLVAGLLSKAGASAQVLELLFGGKLCNFGTEETFAELDEVLKRPKFRLETEKREHFLHLVQETSFHVEALPQFAVRQCRDPKDDKFLSLARQIEAHSLVTLDDDMLELGTPGRTSIRRPADFLRAYRSWS